MREYELMAVYDLAYVEEHGQNASVEHLTGLVERNGGTVASVDHWGRRRLAYPINGQLDADFVVTRVELDPEAVAPLNADFGIEERVYRHLVVRADELPPPRPPAPPPGMRGPRPPDAPPPAPVAPSADAPVATPAPSPDAPTPAPAPVAEAPAPTAPAPVADAPAPAPAEPSAPVPEAPAPAEPPAAPPPPAPAPEASAEPPPAAPPQPGGESPQE